MADTGTIVLVLIGGIVLGVGVVYLGFKTFTTGIPNIIKIIYYFFPYFLILFSFFNDIIVEGNMYWPAPVAGISLVIINTIASRILAGGPIPESDLCGLPGLSKVLPSNLLPQIILFSSTALSYIAAFNTGIGNTDAIAPSWIIAILIPLIQTLVLLFSANCFDNYRLVEWAGSSMTAGVVSSLIAVGLGLAVGGGIGGGLAHSSDFRKLPGPGPTLYGPGGLRRCPDGFPPGLNGSCDRSKGFTSSNDPNVGTCSAPNDQDQFVCEAYKNGELVTTTITESFIGK
jgi:hypothetical protein